MGKVGGTGLGPALKSDRKEEAQSSDLSQNAQERKKMYPGGRISLESSSPKFTVNCRSSHSLGFNYCLNNPLLVENFQVGDWGCLGGFLVHRLP